MLFPLYNILSSSLSPLLMSWNLSEREGQIVELLLKNVTTTKEIGEILKISPITVRNHLERIYKKSDCNNRSNLIVRILHFYMKENTNLNLFYRPPKIMVVDDETIITENIRNYFIELGFIVHSVNSAEEALSKLQVLQFDFVLTDIKMPGIDGRELIKKIKERHIFYPKVIVMTGHDDQKIEEFFDMGVIQFFKKPFEIESLYKCLIENYSDHPLILNYLQNDNYSENLIKLPHIIDLNKNNLGHGGVFIELTEKEIIDLNINEGSFLKIHLKHPTLAPELLPMISQVQFIRYNNCEKYRCGIGVKFLVQHFIRSETFVNYVTQNKVSSFIPLGKIF